MNPEIFGWQHLVFLIISVALMVVGFFFAKKFAKSEKSQNIILKCLGGALLLWIFLNRLSIALKYSEPRWIELIPDSFCGMSSLVLSLAVLFGKRDNPVYHFVWFIALIGGVITMFYPDFIGQNESVFYLPTISGLLHHTLAVATVVALLLFNQITITYKKWYCTVFGFFGYFSVGAFLITVMGYTDAFHMVNPLLSGTPLTAWVVAPIYVVLYSIVVLIVELVRKRQNGKVTEEK